MAEKHHRSHRGRIFVRHHAPSIVAIVLIVLTFASIFGFSLPETPPAQEVLHSIADSFRETGADDGHAAIQICKRLWQQIEDKENAEAAEAAKTTDSGIAFAREKRIVARHVPRQLTAGEIEVLGPAPAHYPSLERTFNTPAQDWLHHAAELSRWLIATCADDIDKSALKAVIEIASESWFIEENAYQELYRALHSGLLPDSAIELTPEEESDALLMACVAHPEARGMTNIVEIACVVQAIINRKDSPLYPDTIYGVISSPNQMAYRPGMGTVDNYTGVDYLAIARDVLYRNKLSAEGYRNVGIVLPPEYVNWRGDGKHNFFKTQGGVTWDYSLPDPYTMDLEGAAAVTAEQAAMVAMTAMPVLSEEEALARLS